MAEHKLPDRTGPFVAGRLVGADEYLGTADIVTRLQDEAARPAIHDLCTDAADEIKRLRDAGDAVASFIHVYMPHAGWTTADRDTAAAVLDKWEKVRYGR